ncbi:MAG: primosomal protein N' [Candidatus Omnitrophica bacterium]|nr:primosomal protein N' [Candidatus Omnitrophota bacterium]
MNLTHYQYIQVVVGRPVEGPFDYSLPETFLGKVSVGMRVRVMFNRKRMTAYVVRMLENSAFAPSRIQPILGVLDELPILDEEAMKLAQWFSDYYGCSLGEALEAYLPLGLRKTKKLKNFQPEQPRFRSGNRDSKREIWIPYDESEFCKQLILRVQCCLDAKQQILVCAPNTFLVQKYYQFLKTRLSAVVRMHEPAMTDNRALSLWQSISEGTVDVMVGSRSAVFSPMKRLGLIVILDEDNDGYKQEQTPHYRVQDVALKRAEYFNAGTIFSSPSPMVETWSNIEYAQWSLQTIGQQAGAVVQLIDLTNYKLSMGFPVSYPLQNEIQRVANENGRILLYMNRKGFSSLTQCNQCGHRIQCGHCDICMTYLYSKNILKCSGCQGTMEMPKHCPQCNSKYMRSIGTGIEKIEKELAKFYPNQTIVRFEQDQQELPRTAKIIIATQAIFKLAGEVKFDSCAVLDIDGELSRIDFRSSQKAFRICQYLRMMAQKKLIIQTRMMDNAEIQLFQRMDPGGFYAHEVRLREEMALPPFSCLVAVVARGENEEEVFRYISRFYQNVLKEGREDIHVSDPHPAIQPKLRDKYRFTIIFKGREPKEMTAFIRKIMKAIRKKKDIIVTLNVNP